MSASLHSDALELVSVLFIDIVGYSLQPIEAQSDLLFILQGAVKGSPEYQKALAAEQVSSLPAGDGMALLFRTHPRSAAQCALEILGSLRYSTIRLRMGVHMGTASLHLDINERNNFVGDGINMAQRVMDCGDAGQILLSQAAAEELKQLREWRDSVHDLGVHAVKHGVQVSIHSLSKDGFGDGVLPSKLRTSGNVFGIADTPQNSTDSSSKKKQSAGTIWSVLGLATTCLPVGLQLLGVKFSPWFGMGLTTAGSLAVLYGVWELLQSWPVVVRNVALGALAAGSIWSGTVAYDYLSKPPESPKNIKVRDVEPTPPRTKQEPAKVPLHEFHVVFYNGASDPEFFVNKVSVHPARYTSGIATFRLAAGSYSIRADYQNQECVAHVSVPASATVAASCTPK